jgi:regulatory subunit for Cdc7p protein kinase
LEDDYGCCMTVKNPLPASSVASRDPSESQPIPQTTKPIAYCTHSRMSTLAIPPSPHVPGAMSNRRMPLANLNNATNSPLRATAVGGKRQRSHASEQRDVFYGQPAQKKQIIEVDDAEARRHGLVRRTGAPQTALTRKLEAARETKVAPRQVQRTQNDLDTIRQWQKHYRRLFPQFVFYFDNVSSVTKDKIMSKAQVLGSVCRTPSSSMMHL